MSKTQKDILVLEPNLILDNFHKLNVTELRVLLWILGNSFIPKDPDNTKEYVLNVDQYAKTFNVTKGHAYDSLVEIVAALPSRVAVIKAKLVDETAGDKAKRVIHFVEMVQYDPEISAIKLRFSKDFTTILNALGETESYTKYYFKSVPQLKNLSAIRLFRLLSRWKFASKVKYFTLEEFKLSLGLRADDYEVFDNFNRKYIQPAMKEVDKIKDLNMGLEWVKEERGRKVIGVKIIKSVVG